MNPGRKPLIAGNWKMFNGGPRACALAAEVAQGAEHFPGVEVVVCPPFTALAAVAAELEGKRVGLGAQNMHAKASGAFTGEVSAPMLIECGARWVIVGHSERRGLFNESDEDVAAKAGAALDHDLTPIVCVGETLGERVVGKTLEVVGRELEAVMPVLERAGGLAVVAYEPVWAIGTGQNATPEQAQQVHAAVREMLARRSPALAEKTRILYGGSVKADNAAALLACPDVDGALVGGASLDARQFLEIVKAAAASLAPPAGPLSPPLSPRFFMLNILLSILHVLASLFLILVVLLQQGKGGGMGALGGAAAQQVFGGGGAGNLLTRLTTVFATIFMGTSVSLAYLASAGDIKLKSRPPSATAPLPTYSLSTPVTPPPPPVTNEAPAPPEAPAPSGTPAP